jgi:hypothetical protein
MTEHLELREAQLFRLLVDTFGIDQVVPKARISLVCGGSVPNPLVGEQAASLDNWAASFRCLFTILNSDDEPRLVVEFYEGFSAAIDAQEVDRERFLPIVLDAKQIRYMRLTHEEFLDLIDPDVEFNFLQLLYEHFGAEHAA